MVPAVLVDLDCLYQFEAGILQRFTPPSATRAYPTQFINQLFK